MKQGVLAESSPGRSGEARRGTPFRPNFIAQMADKAYLDDLDTVAALATRSPRCAGTDRRPTSNDLPDQQGSEFGDTPAWRHGFGLLLAYVDAQTTG